MLNIRARTINRVVKLNNISSVEVKFVALLMKVTITGINATTSTTSTTTPVMSNAPLTRAYIFPRGFIVIHKINKYINVYVVLEK